MTITRIREPIAIIRAALIPSALGICALALILPATTANADSGIYRRGEPGEPETLDPQKTQTVVEADIVYDLFEGLLTYDAEGKLIPGAALSWAISEDGLTYTFALRDEVWSNGDPVTADDFIFAFRRLVDPSTAAPYASLFSVIKNAEPINQGRAAANALGVKALDSHRLEIDLERPTPYFLGLLAHQTAVPIDRAAVVAAGRDAFKPGKLVGNGAYSLVAYTPNDRLTLQRNPTFHDAAKVAIEREEILPLEDRGAAIRRFEAAEIDSYADAPADQIAYLKQRFSGELYLTPSLGNYYYAFNTKKPPFDDARVRLALSMTVDREFLAETIWGGSMAPAYALVPPGIDNYGPPVEPDFAKLAPIDAETRALELLRQAGYGPEGKPLDVEIRYNSSANNQATAIAIADMWKPLGVTTSFVNSDAKSHFAYLRDRGDFDVARAGWLADYSDPQNFLALCDSANAALDYSRWANPRYNALLAQAEGERDLRARAALLAEAETLLLKEQPIAPLMYLESKNLVSKRISGWRPNALDRHLTRYLTLKP